MHDDDGDSDDDEGKTKVKKSYLTYARTTRNSDPNGGDKMRIASL